jgi:hypothetical protein
MAKINKHLKVKNFGTDAIGVELFGDITKPETATFLVYFPGGYVEITRTTTNSYWAHVGVLRSDNSSGTRCDDRKVGNIVDSIVQTGRSNPENTSLDMDRDLIHVRGDWHFAVEIKPEKSV